MASGVSANGKVVLPKAPWILTKKEQNKVKDQIASFLTPIGITHSLKGAFTKIKKKGATQLYGLKTHDCLAQDDAGIYIALSLMLSLYMLI